MKRYSFNSDTLSECNCDIEEYEKGKWVKYEDMERLLDVLTDKVMTIVFEDINEVLTVINEGLSNTEED